MGMLELLVEVKDYNHSTITSWKESIVLSDELEKNPPDNHANGENNCNNDNDNNNNNNDNNDNNNNNH